MPSRHYDVHAIVRIRSEVRLPELEPFRTEASSRPADLEVRIATDPMRSGGRDAIRYREAPGRFGFALAIDRSEMRTVAYASPLLRRSPHVLYTNVVEPLLRWLFVRKGYALLHGACLAFGERALFITARTDTGKTTTILRTVRADSAACRFLSDDMTIVGRDGMALAYPKPLTISRHTVQALGGAPLTLRERLLLEPQSRLHSRGGRGIGMRMAAAGLPAATLSAVVQRLIPPPKFAIDRLIPSARYGVRARLAAVVVIERGPDATVALERDELVPTLIANAEDAYGFPPYPKIAAELSNWNGTDLHALERSVVASAVERLPAARLVSDRFSWHERLPDLIERPFAATARPRPGRAVAAPMDGATGTGAVGRSDPLG